MVDNLSSEQDSKIRLYITILSKVQQNIRNDARISPKSEQKWAHGHQQWADGHQRRSKKGGKGSQKGGKGSQKGAKSEPSGARMSQENLKNNPCGTGSKKERKRKAPDVSVDAIMEPLLSKNQWKMDSKTDTEKMIKMDEIDATIKSSGDASRKRVETS